jgi:tetraacyldisaccharide 4'-kinase
LAKGRGGSVKVIIEPDRVAGARKAVAEGADVLVMDDGFQHRRLRRDLDIVLIDAINPFGYGHCLPRGMLREPLSALADAHVLVITHSDLVDPSELSALREKLAELAPQALIALAEHEPTTVLGPDNEEIDAHLLEGVRVCAFCGLGNPDAFFRTLAKLGCDMIVTIAFDDHAAYTAVEIDRIMTTVASCHAQVLVTTAKDKVKILPAQSLPLPLLVLNMRMKISQGEAELWNKVAAILPKQ